MANRTRPRCANCDRAMDPVYAKRRNGASFQRVSEAFWCRSCGALARGRQDPKFLRATPRPRREAPLPKEVIAWP